MRELTGKVAVITGGASGIGRGLAEAFAAEGMRIVLGDLDERRLREVEVALGEAGTEVLPVRCDVASEASVQALAESAMERFGAAHVVCNNAGVVGRGDPWTGPTSAWEWIVGINLWGVIYGCQLFVPQMRAQGGGHVINVASSAGLLCMPMMAPYNVTKAGVVALSETMCAELKPAGIGVTVLCPTFFRTKIMENSRYHGEGSTLGRVHKMMDRAKMQAPDVARFALDAAAADQLYALPHDDGAWLWRLKRLIPERFYQTLVPRNLGRFTGGKR